MARVFDAFDERLERPVAVKILRSETEALPGMRQRFQQEALHLGAPDPSAHRGGPRLRRGRRRPRTSSWSASPGRTLRDEIVARGPLPTRASRPRHGRDARRPRRRPQVRGAAPRHQAQQHPARRRRPRRRSPTSASPRASTSSGPRRPHRRHDHDRRRPRHARLPRSRTESGSPGHRAVRPLLGRRSHGRGAHGATHRARCAGDRGVATVPPRHRLPRPGREPAGPVSRRRTKCSRRSARPGRPRPVARRPRRRRPHRRPPKPPRSAKAARNGHPDQAAPDATPAQAGPRAAAALSCWPLPPRWPSWPHSCSSSKPAAARRAPRRRRRSTTRPNRNLGRSQRPRPRRQIR